MSVSRSKGGGKARPLLAGSHSVDGTASRDVPSISESEEGGGGGGRLRRHSTTSKDTREVEGSLRKVSKWFRDIKLKMDPIKVKDRIRYSRSSLATQAGVAEEDEEYAIQGVGKTATLRPRKPRIKTMEKRFSSLECLPGSKSAPATAIRKMNSLQFEAENNDPDGLDEETTQPPQDIDAGFSRVDATTPETTVSASSPLSAPSDRLTEEIERKLDEKERLLEEILQMDLDSGWPRHRRGSSSSKVKVGLLESVYLTNQLTRLVNGCIRPEHLFLPRHPTSQHRATDDGLEEDTCNYVRVPSKLADVINRLHDQLTSLMETVELNSDETKTLRDELKAFASASDQTQTLQDATIQRPDANNTERHNHLKKRSSSSSMSDSECFLSLIRDLGEIN